MCPWEDECSLFAADEPLGSDLLLLNRLCPLGDEEAAHIELLCEAIGPGRLVVDDMAGGDGVVVATLPDGRHIVSITPTGSPDDRTWVQAHARLFCHARAYLLRLLHERRRWHREREVLLSRIESLEASQDNLEAGPGAHSGSPLPTRPR